MHPFFKHSVLCAALLGCATTLESPNLGQTDEALTCPVPLIDPARSLMVTDPTALANFSLQRVMTAIATSAHATNTPLAQWQQWMKTFADCSNPAIDPNGYGIVCPRV